MPLKDLIPLAEMIDYAELHAVAYLNALDEESTKATARGMRLEPDMTNSQVANSRRVLAMYLTLLESDFESIAHARRIARQVNILIVRPRHKIERMSSGSWA